MALADAQIRERILDALASAQDAVKGGDIPWERTPDGAVVTFRARGRSTLGPSSEYPDVLLMVAISERADLVDEIETQFASWGERYEP
jgi:hypothetical protein